MARRRRVRRFFERAILGGVMSVIAFVIERRLLKTIKQGGTKKPIEEEVHVETAG
jgi:hypothetical protein